MPEQSLPHTAGRDGRSAGGTAALRSFINANQRLAGWINAWVPHATALPPEAYETAVAHRMNTLPAGAVVVDVGGGKSCPFARYRSPESGVRIVAVDVSAEELAHNEEVDDKLVADVVAGLPFDDEAVDVIASHSVLEHLVDTDAFAAHAARVLKPGGWFIHSFPSKFAPFATINRALPHSVSRRLIHFYWPEAAGKVGFPAFYDNCSPSAMTRVLDRHGFDVVEAPVGYRQSEYFAFFVPVYLVSVLYELLISRLDARELCAHVLMVARRR